jgi:thymidylate synthase
VIHIFIVIIIDQVTEQLTREPHAFPTVKINPNVKNIDDVSYLKISNLLIIIHIATIKGDITVVGGFNEKDRKGFYNEEKRLIP